MYRKVIDSIFIYLSDDPENIHPQIDCDMFPVVATSEP